MVTPDHDPDVEDSLTVYWQSKQLMKPLVKKALNVPLTPGHHSLFSEGHLLI